MYFINIISVVLIGCHFFSVAANNLQGKDSSDSKCRLFESKGYWGSYKTKNAKLTVYAVPSGT